VLKKNGKPDAPESVLPEIRKGWQLSERRACAILTVNRRAVRYRPMRASIDAALRLRIKELAAARVRYGQRRIYVLLRREGWHVNIKRVARIYRAEGLSIRTKTHGAGARQSFASSPLCSRRQTRVGLWTSCTTSSLTVRRSGS